MTAKSTGTWVARFRDADEGKQKKESLGEFEELPPSQRYDAAKRAAEVWFKHLGAGGKSEPITVKAACARYITKLRADHREDAAADAEARFSRWVNDSKIGRIDLQKLRPDDVWGWRSALAQTPAMEQDKSKPSTKLRAASTVNRDMTTLRAALNLALEDGFATTNASWVVKLRPIPDADGRRDVYIDIKQRKALIGESPPDLAVFLRALSMVPLRPWPASTILAARRQLSWPVGGGEVLVSIVELDDAVGGLLRGFGGERSEPCLNQSSGSGGQVTNPAGAVHRPDLWAGDLSTAGASWLSLWRALRLACLPGAPV